MLEFCRLQCYSMVLWSVLQSINFQAIIRLTSVRYESLTSYNPGSYNRTSKHSEAYKQEIQHVAKHLLRFLRPSEFMGHPVCYRCLSYIYYIRRVAQRRLQATHIIHIIIIIIMYIRYIGVALLGYVKLTELPTSFPSIIIVFFFATALLLGGRHAPPTPQQ